MDEVSLNISVPDPNDFSDTIRRAVETGLNVTQSFEDLGVASGTIDRAALPMLRRIHGLQIEEDRTVSVPKRPR